MQSTPPRVRAAMELCSFVAIDPGITHVGMFSGAFTTAPNGARHLTSITHLDSYDTTAAVRADSTGCVRHAHTYASWFVTQLETKHVTSCATQLIVEMQPPGSAGMPLEILIRERFAPSQCTFISPASIHSRFQLRGHTHATRKAKSVRTACDALQGWAASNVAHASAARAHILGMERAHDCADAILLGIMFLERVAAPVRQVPDDAAAAASAPRDVFEFMRSCMHSAHQPRQSVQPAALPIKGEPAGAGSEAAAASIGGGTIAALPLPLM